MNRDLFQWGHVVPVLPAGWLITHAERTPRHLTPQPKTNFQNKTSLRVHSIGGHLILKNFNETNSPVEKKNEKCELFDANLLIFFGKVLKWIGLI